LLLKDDKITRSPARDSQIHARITIQISRNNEVRRATNANRAWLAVLPRTFTQSRKDNHFVAWVVPFSKHNVQCAVAVHVN
jgi:hypothetical protein